MAEFLRRWRFYSDKGGVRPDKTQDAHGFLTVYEQDHARASLTLDFGDKALSSGF
jgi:hypothetical protein